MSLAIQPVPNQTLQQNIDLGHPAQIKPRLSIIVQSRQLPTADTIVSIDSTFVAATVDCKSTLPTLNQQLLHYVFLLFKF